SLGPDEERLPEIAAGVRKVASLTYVMLRLNHFGRRPFLIKGDVVELFYGNAQVGRCRNGAKSCKQSDATLIQIAGSRCTCVVISAFSRQNGLLKSNRLVRG